MRADVSPMKEQVMNHPTVDNLTVAANYLARSPVCSRIVNEMDGFIECWGESPRLYAGELALLNPLIVLGARHPEKYRALLEHVYAARARVAETARMDYQRDLMRRIRAREANAVALEEHVRGKRLTREQRLVYLAQCRRVWAQQRRRFIAQSALPARDALRRYWEMLDARLERDLREALRDADALAPA